MTEELKKQDSQVSEPQEPATPPAEATAEQLKAQLSEAQKKLEQTEKGLKTARQTISEKERQLKEAQDLRGLIQNIQSRVDIHEAYIKDIESKAEEYEAEPSPKKKSSLDDRLKEIERKNYESQYRELAAEAERFVTEAGLDIKIAPEAKVIRNYFRSGDLTLAREAVEMAKEIAESKKQVNVLPEKETKVTDEVKETPEQMKERIKREVYEELGITKPEGGIPATGRRFFTKEQIASMSMEEYKQLKPEIDAAMRAGTIK